VAPGPPVPSVEILAVGTELLSGEVQDTNTRFLALTSTGLGGVVEQARVLPDDFRVLKAAFREALSREPRLVLVCGGLGPTEDDGTLEALAAALGAPLREHPEALDMVGATYAALAERGIVEDGRLTPQRRKMARLPAGSRPVPNPVGAAPGIELTVVRTTFIALPGVPAELEAMVEGTLRPVLRGIFGASVYLDDAVTVHTGDESRLVPALAEVAAAHPAVRVKSRARRLGVAVSVRVTLSTRGEGEKEVRARLVACRDALVAACAARGMELDLP